MVVLRTSSVESGSFSPNPTFPSSLIVSTFPAPPGAVPNIKSSPATPEYILVVPPAVSISKISLTSAFSLNEISPPAAFRRISPPASNIMLPDSPVATVTSLAFATVKVAKLSAS